MFVLLLFDCTHIWLQKASIYEIKYLPRIRWWLRILIKRHRVVFVLVCVRLSDLMWAVDAGVICRCLDHALHGLHHEARSVGRAAIFSLNSGLLVSQSWLTLYWVHVSVSLVNPLKQCANLSYFITDRHFLLLLHDFLLHCSYLTLWRLTLLHIKHVKILLKM